MAADIQTRDDDCVVAAADDPGMVQHPVVGGGVDLALLSGRC